MASAKIGGPTSQADSTTFRQQALHEIAVTLEPFLAKNEEYRNAFKVCMHSGCSVVATHADPCRMVRLCKSRSESFSSE